MEISFRNVKYYVTSPTPNYYNFTPTSITFLAIFGRKCHFWHFWSKMPFLAIFGRKCHFWSKMPFLAIFGRKCHFWSKMPFLVENAIFGHFRSKIAFGLTRLKKFKTSSTAAAGTIKYYKASRRPNSGGVFKYNPK